jgi:ribosomal-protein-alanine N-acetyltransferase
MNQTFFVTKAVPSDIDGIMAIEDAAFPKGIRESAETFLERLSVFPAGNTILQEDKTPSEARNPAGYFCSELWDEIPPQKAEFYALEHSIKEKHQSGGEILYISSLAIMPNAKGQGRFLFDESIKLIRAENPHIRSTILLVNELWLPARRIYETEGFRYTGKLESFFSEVKNDEKLVRSDALLMQKDLS